MSIHYVDRKSNPFKPCNMFEEIFLWDNVIRAVPEIFISPLGWQHLFYYGWPHIVKTKK